MLSCECRPIEEILLADHLLESPEKLCLRNIVVVRVVL